jgi:CspA family cold shock protein
MKSGTVKFYNTDKGYGFIKPEDGSSEIFVHCSALEKIGVRALETNQSVQYEVATNKGRINAVNIKIVA